ncbi:hypothetical protein [Hymenobacter sp. YC55]|uniref:hypothetical protein n=1 Tax=Hymenobacter sp. YC55 TaxID=3034019 RepID=UPI0023F6D6F7|nr:hypothetical protein [Hymenobacter sp. YC55]MDF7810713.1 hypothetical protein [Hymenobacter sp. YC55]
MSTKAKTAPAAKAVAKPKLDLKTLQAQQLSGEDLTTAKGNGDDSYEFPEHEAQFIHLKLTRKENDPVKKEYVTIEKTVKLYPLQYERMEKNGTFAEYDSQTILHDPRTKAAVSEASKPAQPGQAKEPMTPISTLPSLQDAQMRYKQVYEQDAPAVGYDELVELIKEKNGLTDEELEETATV